MTGVPAAQAVRKISGGGANGRGPAAGKLGGDYRSQKARLEQLMPLVAGGDPERGRKVFYSSQGVCSACPTAWATTATSGMSCSRRAFCER